LIKQKKGEKNENITKIEKKERKYLGQL